MSKAIQCKTLPGNTEAFSKLATHVAEFYPQVFQLLSPTESIGSNLVFKWTGSDTTLRPAIISAHQDVVPAPEDPAWTHDPFSGDITDGFICGRGSFDDKGSLIAILEACELLLATGFIPRRSWVIAFGCDEETHGTEGACRIAASLRRQNIEPEFVLDEGGAVVEGFLKGIDTPVAVIGIAEKGKVDIEISCTRQGGHSSTPEHPIALETVCSAVAKLSQNQMPARICEPVKLMLEALSPVIAFPLSLVFSHARFFSPLVTGILGKKSVTNAMVRSTHVTTMAHGSDTINSISESATALVNCRLLPNDTDATVLTWMHAVLKGLPVTLKSIGYTAPSDISTLETPAWHSIKDTITAVFPTSTVVPYLMLGGTDAYWYTSLCNRVYRFSPMLMNKQELSGMHGINERLSLENLDRAIHFYSYLFEHA